MYRLQKIRNGREAETFVEPHGGGCFVFADVLTVAGAVIPFLMRSRCASGFPRPCTCIHTSSFTCFAQECFPRLVSMFIVATFFHDSFRLVSGFCSAAAHGQAPAVVSSQVVTLHADKRT